MVEVVGSRFGQLIGAYDIHYGVLDFNKSDVMHFNRGSDKGHSRYQQFNNLAVWM